MNSGSWSGDIHICKHTCHHHRGPIRKKGNCYIHQPQPKAQEFFLENWEWECLNFRCRFEFHPQEQKAAGVSFKIKKKKISKY